MSILLDYSFTFNLSCGLLLPIYNVKLLAILAVNYLVGIIRMWRDSQNPQNFELL